MLVLSFCSDRFGVPGVAEAGSGAIVVSFVIAMCRRSPSIDDEISFRSFSALGKGACGLKRDKQRCLSLHHAESFTLSRGSADTDFVSRVKS